jgi:cytochrome c oxidase subunit 3
MAESDSTNLNTTARIVVDVRDFSRFPLRRVAPMWWGIIGLIIIEMMVVLTFTVSYFYLQMRAEQWPPPEVPLPDTIIPSFSLGILLVSCITMYLAGRAIDRNQVKRFVVYTLSSVFLAGLVLILRWQKFEELRFRWDEHVYGSLVWTLSGFHFVHVVSAAIGTFVIAIAGMIGYFNKQRQIGVIVDTMYWNFVALAWIPFYFVLYWVPRLI